MHHFFVEPGQIQDGQVRITGPDVNHMKNVLRMRPGEEFLVSGGGNDLLCAVEGLDASGNSRPGSCPPESGSSRDCPRATRWN